VEEIAERLSGRSSKCEGRRKIEEALEESVVTPKFGWGEGKSLPASQWGIVNRVAKEGWANVPRGGISSENTAVSAGEGGGKKKETS